MVFYSLTEALKAGFYVYDATPDGYLLRRHRNNRWELALLKLKENRDAQDIGA